MLTRVSVTLRSGVQQLPHFRAQAIVFVTSLHSWLGLRGASSSAGSPDQFTQQLQHKTEKEILELLENARKKVETEADDSVNNANHHTSKQEETERAGEIGGPKGPEPTRFGDWEVKGRVSDF